MIDNENKRIVIKSNSNKPYGIDILHDGVPGVGFKVYDVYNDSLKSHLKKCDIIKFVGGVDWMVDCSNLPFEEFQSVMLNLKDMELVEITVELGSISLAENQGGG